ncbi:MAG TPA: class I SAM-dependent methyltransferase [Polyangiaceae bacterium]|jgi:SAM-dependent methyltransferase
MPLPLWARALRRADRVAWYAYHAHEILRDELLFAWLRPEHWSELTVEAYSDLATYLPGGSTFEGGLFGWEQAMLAREQIPKSGRVLLAAAGGGRELKALAERGYEVVAFEPNARLFAGASAVAAQHDGTRLLRASYRDLLGAVHGSGPLQDLARSTFHWILLGWGSFTHVTDPEDRRTILRSLRTLCPGAPIALSFFLRRPSDSVKSRSDRLRAVLRAGMHRLGGSAEREPGLGYEFSGGFVHSFTKDEFDDLAESTGYRLLVWDDTAFPYAILAPR